LTNTVRTVQVAERGDGDGAETGCPRAPRVFRLLGAAALVGAIVAVGAGSAAADVVDSAYVLFDVHCTPAGDGVLDLTLVNDSADVAASFTVKWRDDDPSAAVLVAPSSAHALSFTQLADGNVDVPVAIDGVATVVHADVECDPPRLTEALRATVNQGTASVDTAELPRTGGDWGGFAVGGVLVSAGIAASLLARRRYS
jgi:hypothetical protein